MKREKYLQVLSFLCILTLLSGVTSSKDSEALIDRISVLTGKLNTKILVESQSPLPVLRSQYSAELPATIVVDFKCSDSPMEPRLEHSGSALVKDIKMGKGDTDNLRLLIDLEEKVPYRIYNSQKTTIIELNNLKNDGGFILDAETGRSTIHLNDLDISEDDNSLDVTARMSEAAFSHVFALDNPLRLVVDLYDTVLTSRKTDFNINKLGVKRVRSAQFHHEDPYTITRLVFDLDEPKFYTISSDDDHVTVSFFKEVNLDATLMSGKPEIEKPADTITEVAQAVEPEMQMGTQISQASMEIDPEATQKPAAEEEIQSASVQETPAPVVSEKEFLQDNETPPAENTSDGNQEEAMMTELDSLMESQPKPEENIEATKPESNGAAAKHNGNGKIVAYPQEQQFVPQTVDAPEEKYSGEILSMKFKDADLRDVILYLGDFAGLNVVFDPEVRGVVTVDLKDIPWDQALDIILKTNKMGKTLEGNVLRIAPTNILTREQEEERRLRESKVMSGPMVVKTFTLSYSRAGEVESLLRTKMSERGEIIVDERTNTLIITEVRDRMDVLERLIDVFDTATPQVSIEARIVEATSTFIRNLGVQWGFRGISDPFYGNQTSLKFPNRGVVDGALIPQGIVTKGIGGPLGGYAVNLPAPAFSTAIGLSMANVLDTFRIDMALSALETSGEGRIISAPKVTTQNNQEAEIIQGRQIPVQTVANFTVTTRYVNAALELRATPQITAEGTIIMYIQLRNNAADFANLVNGIPPITTQSAQTTVMVPNGGTTVIGGIYRTEDSITRERVPFFHKIPILGNLFKNFARTKQTRELLIFITPRIIR
ncbi:MAG: type IV pilus secretin PilQ [Candidatus Aminicenantes bacterium]|nr:type IV pilus secretin PilQ [Candidatus Aminicenantes bacterium]